MMKAATTTISTAIATLLYARANRDDLQRLRSSHAQCCSKQTRPTATLRFVLLAVLSAALLLGESDAMPQLVQRFESERYTQHARADPDATFHLAVGLHVHDFDALERKLWQVSNPQYVTVRCLISATASACACSLLFSILTHVRLHS